MNYADLKSSSLSIADRADDVDLVAEFDTFLRIVEAKTNRKLKTLDMSTRVIIDSLPDTVYYGLPTDFDGMRNLQILDNAGGDKPKTVTARYKTPAKLDETSNRTIINDAVYYSIINQQVHIEPQLSGTQSMEMIYYKKVPALDVTNDTNWLGDNNPDTYLFGLIAEMNAFAKDAEAASIWNDRFVGSLDEITNNDIDIRWNSGDQLVIEAL